MRMERPAVRLRILGIRQEHEGRDRVLRPGLRMPPYGLRLGVSRSPPPSRNTPYAQGQLSVGCSPRDVEGCHKRGAKWGALPPQKRQVGRYCERLTGSSTHCPALQRSGSQGFPSRLGGRSKSGRPTHRITKSRRSHEFGGSFIAGPRR